MPVNFSTSLSSPFSTRAGILYVLAGMALVSINDMLVKLMSGDYPLHEMIFARSVVGISVSLLILRFEGGWRLLKTRNPGLHLIRAVLVVVANMAYFAALAVMPLADATALFFVAPLCIALLSIPVLGEKVGPRRIVAVLVGLLGVAAIARPGADWGDAAPPGWAVALPLAAAFAYAGMQVLTRKLGATTQASAMAIHVQGAFLLTGAAFFLATGDGRFAENLANESLVFLLRSWVWPTPEDWPLFILLGLCSGGIGYSLSQAYRLGDAATVAPFEYAVLPLAIFWGWAVFGDVPGVRVLAGIALIAGSGICVFLLERRRNPSVPSARPARRW